MTYRITLVISFTIFFFSCNKGLNNIHGASITKEYPIGGGEGYDKIINKRNCQYVIYNLEELLVALDDANQGDYIYIDDYTSLDLTTVKNIQINKSITLCSGRGHKGSRGAILYTKNEKTDLFTINVSNVRITGLRINGPDTLVRYEEMLALDKGGKYYDKPISRAILTNEAAKATDNLEIDNCEIWGWSHTAILLREGALNSKIHHNYIHHNQRYGLGYGICLDASSATIHSNIFDYNRHDINGTGRSGTAYEAYNNIILTNGTGHSFDMHGGGDRGDGTNLAGEYVHIHHNTFYSTNVPAFFLRGTPQNYAKITNNLFYHSGKENTVLPIRSLSESSKIKLKNNKYTEKKYQIDSLIIKYINW